MGFVACAVLTMMRQEERPLRTIILVMVNTPVRRGMVLKIGMEGSDLRHLLLLRSRTELPKRMSGNVMRRLLEGCNFRRRRCKEGPCRLMSAVGHCSWEIAESFQWGHLQLHGEMQLARLSPAPSGAVLSVGWRSARPLLPTLYSMKSLASDLRMLLRRRFMPAWDIEDNGACFIVRDANGQALAYVYRRVGQIRVEIHRMMSAVVQLVFIGPPDRAGRTGPIASG
jgi:hypothetical protein